MQIVVIYKHHHLEKESVLAISISSVAVALIFLSIFVGWIFWRRNQNDPACKNGQGLGIAFVETHFVVPSSLLIAVFISFS